MCFAKMYRGYYDDVKKKEKKSSFRWFFLFVFLRALWEYYLTFFFNVSQECHKFVENCVIKVSNRGTNYNNYHKHIEKGRLRIPRNRTLYVRKKTFILFYSVKRWQLNGWHKDYIIGVRKVLLGVPKSIKKDAMYGSKILIICVEDST